MRSAAFFVALVALATPALAAPTRAEIASARRLFAEAEREEAAERWAIALEKLRTVLAIKETSGVRFHVAHCEERLGQLVAALADYRRAAELADSLSGAERDDLVKRSADEIAALEPRLPTVKIVLPEGVSGASATLDDKPIALATPPAPLRLDPGEYQLVVTAPGRVAFRDKLLLVERSTYAVEVVLPLDQPAKPAVVAEPPRSTAAPLEPPAPGASSGPSTLTYVAAGATIALAATSVYFYTRKKSLEDDTASACATSHCDASARQDSIDSAKTTMLATGAGAVLAAGVTVTLAITSMHRPTRAAIVVGPQGAFFTGAF